MSDPTADDQRADTRQLAKVPGIIVAAIAFFLVAVAVGLVILFA